MPPTNRIGKAHTSRGLTVFLGALLMLTSCRTASLDSRLGQNPSPDSKSNPSQDLKSFQIVQGTPYLVAAIVDGTTRKWSSSSYGGSGSTRNLVFLESGSLDSYRLFPANEYVILESQQYPETSLEKKRGTLPVTRWFGYRVLTEDTNKNGQLDNNDHQSFGISAASGKDYTEVLAGISTWLGSTEVEPGRLLVVYEKNGKKTTSLVDLEKRSVLKSKPLTELGDEVR